MQQVNVRFNLTEAFWGLLGLVLITLKLCKVVDWSWWWVTLPLWGPAAAVLTIILGIGAFLGVAYILDKVFPNKPKRV